MAAAGQRTKQSTRQSAEKVARGYFEALGARDPEAAAGHWRDDGIDEVVPLGVYRGSGEIRGFLQGLVAAMPDMETTVERVTGKGRVAVVEWRISGTFSGAPFQGIDPTGRRVELRGCDCVEVEDGMIVRNTAYYDGMAFARAVGMMPPQDSPAERAMKTAFNGLTKVRGALR